MARKKTEIEAGDLTIEITQLSAEDAPLGMARAGRLYGGLFANAGDMAAMMEAFYRSFGDADFTWLRAKFLANSKQVITVQLSDKADGSPGGTETKLVPLRLETFDGALADQIGWMVECVKWNFADFLGVVIRSAPRPPAKTPDGSTSLTS